MLWDPYSTYGQENEGTGKVILLANKRAMQVLEMTPITMPIYSYEIHVE